MNNNWQPQQSLGGLIITLGMRITKVIKQVLKENGLEHLSFAKINVLLILTKHDVTQVELCNALKQKPASMTELLNRMRKEGSANVKINPRDKRQKIWFLTPQGEQELKMTHQLLMGLGDQMGGFFTKAGIEISQIDDTKQLLRLMERDMFNFLQVNY